MQDMHLSKPIKLYSMKSDPYCIQISKNHSRGWGAPRNDDDYDKTICVPNVWSNLSEGMRLKGADLSIFGNMWSIKD